MTTCDLSIMVRTTAPARLWPCCSDVPAANHWKSERLNSATNYCKFRWTAPYAPTWCYIQSDLWSYRWPTQVPNACTLGPESSLETWCYQKSADQEHNFFKSSTWTYVCMYVFMYVCMYDVCMYICIYVYMYINVYICIYMCIYVYICIYMYVCMYLFVWYVCMYLFVCVCMCMYMYMNMYVYFYVYIYM